MFVDVLTYATDCACGLSYEQGNICFRGLCLHCVSKINFYIIFQVDEREARFKNMPAWKRALVEKKEAEAK